MLSVGPASLRAHAEIIAPAAGLGAAAPFPLPPPAVALAFSAAWVLAVVLGILATILYQRLKRTRSYLAATEERFAQAALQSRTVVWECSADGLYTFVSPASAEVYGYAPEDIAGKLHVWDLHPEAGREAFRAQVLEQIAARAALTEYHNPVQTRDGRIITVTSSAYPMYDAAGNLVGYRGTDLDITRHIAAESALRDSETRLRHAMDAASDGIWDWNFVTGEMDLSPRVYEMMGYEPGEFRTTPDNWAERMHPDDIPNAERALADQLSGPGTVGVAECRMAKKGGGYVWTLSRGKVVETTPDGKPLRIVGTVTDITKRKEALAALETSEARFRSIFELGLIGMAITTTDGRASLFNEQLCRITGYTQEELAQKSFAELTHPDDLEEEREILKAVLAGEQEGYRLEKRLLRADGSIAHVAVAVRGVRLEDGTVDHVISLIEDVTERKEAQAALLERETQLRYAMEAAQDGIWDWDLISGTFDLNPRMYEMMGYAPGAFEMTSENWLDIVHPDDREIALTCLQRGVTSEDGTGDAEYRLLTPDGRLLWVHARGKLVERTPEGFPARIVGTMTDITGRKQTQEALEASDALFENLTANMPGIIFQFQAWPDGRTAVPYISEGVREFCEIIPEQLREDAMIIMEHLHPDDRQRVVEDIRSSFATLDIWTAEFRAITPNGVRWMHGRSRPRKQEDGSVLWHGYIADITQQKEAEEAALESEVRSQRQRSAMAELAVNPAIATGHLELAKHQLAELAAHTIGVERVSLWHLSEDDTELVCFELYEASKDEHSEGIVLCSEDYLPYFEGIRRFGRIVANDARSDPFTACFTESYLEPLGITSMLDAGFYLDGRLAGVICFEHTGEPRTWHADEESFTSTLAAKTAQLLANAERRKAEKALAARDALFARLSENVPGFLYQFQMWPDGRSCFPFASQGIHTTYEIDPEAVREDASAIWDRVHPEDHESLRTAIQESMRTGKVWSQTFRLVLPARGIRWMRGQARPEQQADGSTLWHGYTSDITEQVEAFEERCQLEQQFERTQRLESLGVMAGGIAHDFNNILMAVLANAEMIQHELPADSSAVKHLSEIHAAANRAAELSRQMLAYAGKASMVSEHIQIGAMVEELSQLLRASIPKKVTLVIDDSPDAPPVDGDASQLGQVIMNLIINGAEAIGEHGGEVRVGIHPAALNEGESMRWGFDEVLAPGAYCMIEVTDTGSGMDPRTRARIFEPFFTTKFTGRGLGLSAVLGIVRAHNGALSVKSKPGKGSQFRVLLPASSSPRPEAPSNPSLTEDPSFQWEGSVLLVDDEPALRVVGQRMLTRMGCRVWTAEDGLEALKVFEAHAGEVDLVILDLTMPNMDGHETLIELRKLDPEVPVIIASGFSGEDLAARFEGQAIAGTLQKPFGYHKLEAAVRAFLARRQMV